MDQSSLPINQPHHTKLVILLAVVIILAIIFFGIRANITDNPSGNFVDTGASGQLPLEIKRSPPTAEEAEALRAVLHDKSLSKQTVLTPKQSTDLKKVLADPSLSKRDGMYEN